MMLLAVLSISAIFAGNFVEFGQLAHSTGVGSEFAQIVKNGTNKLSVEFTKILFDELEPHKNFVFSPLNIYACLALMHLGATNATKNELSDVLGFPTEESKLPTAHQYLGQLLNDVRSSVNLAYTTVKIANGVFIQKEINVNEKFVDRVANYYNGRFQKVDFANGGPEATNFINEWIANDTENLIPSMLQNELPTDTIILPASVSHFSGTTSLYYLSFTETKSFYTGTELLLVPTMRMNATMYYFKNTILKFEAVILQFWSREDKYWTWMWKGGHSMLIILPQKGESMRTLISSLKSDQILETINSLQEARLEFEIPHFKFGWSRNIIQHLKTLGVKRLFEKAAHNNMVHLNNSMISNVIHAAEIKFVAQSKPARDPFAKYRLPPLIQFHVNRPFLFAVYHEQNGNILLTGLVRNPVDENAH